MTNVTDQQKRFEAEFKRFERLRMYPPGYEKESKMTRLKYKHIACITRAQNLLETGVNIHENESLKKSIENDVKLLCEIRDILFYALENPTLPFDTSKIDEADPILNQIEDDPNGAF